MKTAILLSLIIILCSCRKRHDPIYGQVNISGKVTDIVSGAGIPYAVVYLYEVRIIRGLVSSGPDITNVVAVKDTADMSGNYSMSVDANGQYEFELRADPMNPGYVSSVFSSGVNHQRIKTTGTFTLNQPCYRSAYARVQVVNVAPVDTVYSLSLYAGAGDITLHNYYKDTVVYVKLVGRSDYPNQIHFYSSNGQDKSYDRTVGPRDTIQMQFDY